MITDMDVNPDHPLAAQAFTSFRVPGGLLEGTLILIVVGLAGYTVWEAVAATGTFANAPGVIRGAVVAGIVYLAVRWIRAGLRHWQRHSPRGGIGPAIERIEP